MLPMSLSMGVVELWLSSYGKKAHSSSNVRRNVPWIVFFVPLDIVTVAYSLLIIMTPSSTTSTCSRWLGQVVQYAVVPACSCCAQVVKRSYLQNVVIRVALQFPTARILLSPSATLYPAKFIIVPLCWTENRVTN